MPALAPDREHVVARLRRYAKDLEVLNQIARIATEDLELSPMLQRITDALAAKFDWEFVACVSIDSEKQRFVCEAVTSRLPTEIEVGYTRPLGSGVVGEVAATGRPILIDDVSTHANYVETMRGAVSELCYPVHHGSRLVAIINLESTRPAAFHDQVGLLATVADQIAGAIESARRFDEVRRRAGHLAMVGEVSRTAMESGELSPLLDRVTAYIQQRLGLSLVAILLADEREGDFVLAAFSGTLLLNVPRGARLPAGKGIIGRAVREGGPQLVLDVSMDPDYVMVNPEVAAEFDLPIHFQGRLLGVVNIQSMSAAAFSTENVALLRMFTDQVAGAIAGARLHEDVKRANRTLSDLFARYVAPDLAESLIADPDRFRNRGERREVTVLFADIRGFTGLSQRLDSEQVLGLLNDYYTAMGEVIFAHRGSINRILGDGLLAVFGVPERIAEHEKAAVGAARGIQEAALRLSPRWESVTGSPLRVAVAVNCGPVVVGTVGDRRHTEFTVLGDIVNVAARLEREAKDRDVPVLLTGAVASRLDGATAVQPLGTIELRGREGTVEIFRLC